MKALFLLAAALPLFSDVEISGTLPAHLHREEFVAVDSGKWGIEVFSNGDAADLTCTYIHLNEVVLKQEHTHHCFATTNNVLPAYITVNVANNESHSVAYKVRAYSMMKLK